MNKYEEEREGWIVLYGEIERGTDVSVGGRSVGLEFCHTSMEMVREMARGEIKSKIRTCEGMMSYQGVVFKSWHPS